MDKEIQYVEDSVFAKMTKKQKFEMPEVWVSGEVEITRLVIIPSNRKSDGYLTGDFFALSPEEGWWRPTRYDCWRITSDLDSPATPRDSLLKGDFENGGVQIFGFVDEHHKAYMSYGGEIVIKKNPN